MRSSIPNRREFVRALVVGGAVSILGRLKKTSDLQAQVVSGNQPGVIRVRISDFPVLQNEKSSLRLSINPANLFGPDGNFYPIMINRGVANSFYAMTTQCQHASCVVEAYDPDNFGILCFCHNSRYDIDGSVLRPPAISPLPRFNISFDGLDTLTVIIPNLGYSIDIKPSASTSGPRVQLDFPTFSNAVYRVQFREKVSEPWVPINFAVSPDGDLGQSSLTGSGNNQSVWAAKVKTTGFYSVSLEVKNYN